LNWTTRARRTWLSVVGRSGLSQPSPTCVDVNVTEPSPAELVAISVHGKVL